MAIVEAGAVQREVQRAFTAATVAGMTDAQLVERFAAGRDGSAEAAFEALVSKHGPMVLGVCRGMLADPNDVADAFQATFLVLVRKAGSLWVNGSLGPWLHGVAHRVASRARSEAARRRTREQPGVEWAASPRRDDDPWDDLRPLLHEELGRLPEKYRAPIVLCYLEGRTHEEAAEALRWPVGTVRSRLSRGRERLRSRLGRRGVASTAGLLAAMSAARPAPAAVQAGLAGATIKAAIQVAAGRATAAGVVSASVVALTEGVIMTMSLARLKTSATLALAAAAVVVATGVGVFARQAPGEPQPAPPGAAPVTTAVPTPGLPVNQNPPPAARPAPPATEAGADVKAEPPLVLEARLRRALRALDRAERLSRTGSVSSSEYDEAVSEVDVLMAQLDSQQQDAQDELERLRAALTTKAAEGRVADAEVNRVKKVLEVHKVMSRPGEADSGLGPENYHLMAVEAQRAVKSAEAGEMKVRITQTERRLEQFKRLKRELGRGRHPSPSYVPAASPTAPHAGPPDGPKGGSAR